MNTDFRALCARMADELDHYRQLLTDNRLESHPLSAEARAALSAPEQEPTEAEVADLAENLEYQRLPQDTSTGPSFLLEFARAVLTRWGRPAVEPVAVAEGLPEPEDCDDQGRCWWWIVDQPGELPYWIYCQLEVLSWTNFTAWAPHWALPVPPEGE
jgi:hypothetical protein